MGGFVEFERRPPTPNPSPPLASARGGRGTDRRCRSCFSLAASRSATICVPRQSSPIAAPSPVRLPRGGSGRGAIRRGDARDRDRCRRGRARSAAAAISAPSAASPAAAASTTMRAMRGGSGSSRRRRPRSVMRPSASIAPSSRSSALASVQAARGGGSRKSSFCGSVTPQCARSSTRPDRSAARISGVFDGRKRSGLRLVPQPVADAGLGAAGAAAALIGRRARDPHGFQPRQADIGLVARHARQAAVDHDAHALDGERGLRDRRRQHDLAPARRRRRDGAVLHVGLERAEQRDHIDRGIGDALAQLRLGAADLGGTRQERQHRPGLRAQRPRHRIRHLALDRRRRIAAEIARLDRKGAAFALRPPARRPAASPPARRRWSPTSPGASDPRAGRAARRAPAPSPDRHRASARGTRRTAAPRRRRATGSSSTMRVNTPSVTTSMRVLRDTLEPKRTR